MYTANYFFFIISIIQMGQLYTFFDEAAREQNWRLLPHVNGSLKYDVHIFV